MVEINTIPVVRLCQGRSAGPARRYLRPMPVIVVGADTPQGEAILTGLCEPGREVRAFVSDAGAGRRLKSRGLKVAVGDVSDDSHVGAAAVGCFTAVLIAEAASDVRERSFASGPEAVLSGWARAVRASGVSRVIWLSADDPPVTDPIESAAVAPGASDAVERVVALDAAQTIGAGP